MTDTAADIDLDALIDRLLERAAERAGPLLNVEGQDVEGRAAAGRVTVNPGDIVASNWGNLVYGQSVNVFLSTADRDTQWPTPADGATCYTQDTGTLWLRKAGQWVQVYPVPSAYAHVFSAAAQTMTGGANTVINFDTVEAQVGTGWNPATHAYVVPLAGRWHVDAGIMWNAIPAVNSTFYLQLFKNGANLRRGATYNAGQLSNPLATVVTTAVLAVGDSLTVTANPSATGPTFATAPYTYAQFNYLGP